MEYHERIFENWEASRGTEFDGNAEIGGWKIKSDGFELELSLFRYAHRLLSSAYDTETEHFPNWEQRKGGRTIFRSCTCHRKTITTEMSIEKCIVKYKEYFESESTELTQRGPLTENGKSKTLTGNIVEINEVIQLDPHIAPVSKPSQFVERLNAKRKSRHAELINKLGEALNDLNMKIEENVRISSEEVKAHINKDRRDLSEILDGLNVPESGCYHDSVFLTIRNKAEKMKTHQLRLIKELHQDLHKMEDIRSVENNKIFQSIFKEIEKNAYINSFELQHFAEQEALKMNQLSLNNRRCYEDLRLKLVLGAEHMFKSFMDEVFYTKDKWIRHNMMEPTDNLPSKNEVRYVKIPNKETRIELTGYELNLRPTPDGCYNISVGEEWFANVKDVTKAIGSHQNMLGEMFKRVLQSIEKDLSNENEADRKCVLSLENLRFEERLIQPILFEASEGIDEMINGLEVYWQDTVKCARQEIENVIDYLSGFGELWTNHSERLCESKILVLKAVEKAEENDRSALQELEVNLNVNLDLLRQEYNKDKIEFFFKAVTANLDAIKDKLESSYINNAKITEEYYKMMDLEGDVLSSELKEFIFGKHLNQSHCRESSQQEENQILPMSEAEGETGLEAAAEMRGLIENFSAEIKSMRFWIFEVNNELEELSDNARDRLAWRAEEWINNRIRDMSGKYQTQLEIHMKRYERVRSQIYQVRMEEIRIHQQVFDGHKAGVSQLCKGLSRAVETFYEKGLEKIGKWKMKAGEIMEEAKKEDKPEIVRCIQAKMSKEKSDFIRGLTAESDRIRGGIELKTCSAQRSNLKFMKSIKLFHENGNYEADEGKLYATGIETIERETAAEVKFIMKDINKKESEIIQKVSDIFDEANRALSQIYEELKFNSGVNNTAGLCEKELGEVCENLRSDFEFSAKEKLSLAHSISDDGNQIVGDQDERWMRLIDSVCKLFCNLFYEIELPVWEGASDEGVVNISRDSKEEEEIESQAKGGSSSEDYTHELFESSLLTGRVPLFINVIRRKCMKYIGLIQRASSAFYKKSGSKLLIRRDIIRASNEDFGISSLEGFRSFVLRCEQVWLEITSSFLPLLGELDGLFEGYCEMRARELAESVMSALDNCDAEFSKCLAEKARITEMELQRFDSRLLPLHGHPNNKQLFDALEDEVVRKTAQLELDWEVFIQKYRAKLKLFRADMKHHPQWQALRSFYLKCQGVLFSDALKKDLLNYLMEVFGKGGFIKKKGKQIVEEAEGFDTRTPGWSLPKELRDIDEYLTAGTTARGKRPKDFEEMVEGYVIKMEARHREIKDFINSKSNFHKDVISEWLNQWKANVGKISELYNVKYGHSKDIFEGSFE